MNCDNFFLFCALIHNQLGFQLARACRPSCNPSLQIWLGQRLQITAAPPWQARKCKPIALSAVKAYIDSGDYRSPQVDCTVCLPCVQYAVLACAVAFDTGQVIPYAAATGVLMCTWCGDGAHGEGNHPASTFWLPVAGLGQMRATWLPAPRGPLKALSGKLTLPRSSNIVIDSSINRKHCYIKLRACWKWEGQWATACLLLTAVIVRAAMPWCSRWKGTVVQQNMPSQWRFSQPMRMKRLLWSFHVLPWLVMLINRRCQVGCHSLNANVPP
jgi:hypothetical protein